MGYAGGHSTSPTYRNIGGHAEVLQIDFDPARIGFEALLDLFWRGHQPTRDRGDSQYRSMILASPSQLDAARASHAEQEREQGRRLYTEITELERFTRAEDYHQKYYLGRVRGVRQALQARFSNFAAFVDSTAVTRANAYAGGNGSRRQLDAERESLGLSDSSFTALRDCL